ncbi:MAG: hypothetical protein IJ379_10750, partial [Lachnospiraceae bacterium]|nr:hypothetical protein [Lachnospiraceae bacterium]
VRHAASFHPEPGSNSHVKKFVPSQKTFLAFTVFGLNIFIFTVLNFYESSFRFCSFDCCLLLRIFKVALLFICQRALPLYLSDSLFRISHLFRFVNNFLNIFSLFSNSLSSKAKKKKSQSLKILFCIGKSGERGI